MQGPYWPAANGDEKDARAWVEGHTSVFFTDPGGVTGVLRGSGELTEVN
jgi:hypothetical protein